MLKCESRKARSSIFYPKCPLSSRAASRPHERHYLSLVRALSRQIVLQYLAFISPMQHNKSQESQDYLRSQQGKAKYSKTSMKKKTQLINLVTEQKWSIYKASKKLKLSNSTAKSILRNFQKYGTLLSKFTKNRILKLRQMEQSAETAPKGIPMIKTQENLERIVIKVEQQAENEKHGEILENNVDYYPFFPFSTPIYYQFQQ